MTNSSVTFPGTLNGSGGTNSLVYEKARDPIIDAVDRGETPNIGTVLNVSSVTAEPIYKRIEVAVAKGVELIDTTLYKGDERIVKKGLGRLILASANTHSGGVLVESGEVVIRDPAALGGGGLEITGTATTTLDLTGGTLALSRLKLSSGTRLELGDGSLTVGGGGFTAVDIRQAIIAGRNGGSWDGTTGITSAAAGTQGGASIAATNTFGIGYTIDGSGGLKIETVLEGDTDLDGSVDFDDILALFPNYNVAGSYTWQGGDITYDGAVDFDDILALFPNYGTTLGAGASGLGTGGGGGTAAGLLGFGGGSGSGAGTSGDQPAAERPGTGGDTETTPTPVMGPQPPSDLVIPPRTTLVRYASDPSGDAASDATSLAFAALAVEENQASSSSKKTNDRLFATL
jgi:autotransporter-associated beta strand protein